MVYVETQYKYSGCDEVVIIDDVKFTFSLKRDNRVHIGARIVDEENPCRFVLINVPYTMTLNPKKTYRVGFVVKNGVHKIYAKRVRNGGLLKWLLHQK